MTDCVCDGRFGLVSLFDGIAGFPLAFSSAGVRTIATCEIDKAAAGVAGEHFPEAKAFSDITEVTADDILAAGFCPVHGILSAGWPCQGNSLAGKRGGMADPRSGLWREVVRLLGALKPAWFVGENVPGLLTVNKGDDMRVVMSDLESLGYLIELDIHDAQFFGVPQRRRRLVFTCQNLSRLLPKKTTTSALTLAQCLTEISLLSFLVQSQAYGKEYAPWVSREACVDGLLRRMRQFEMQRQAESGWDLWLSVLAGDSARRALALGISDSRLGDSIEAALGWTATDTSSTTTTGLVTGTSSAIESSWRRLLDALYDLAKSSTTSPPTSWITNPRISTSARTLLNISAYTAALTASFPTFSQPASSASTAIGVLTNYARSAGESLFANVDGFYDVVELGPTADSLLVALGHLGDSAGPVEVLLEPARGGRHPAARGAAGAGFAGGTGDSVANTGTAARGIAPTLAGGGRRGYRIDAETAAGGGHETTALTRNGITGVDDNTAQGNQLVPVEPEVWQQQGSKLQPMGTMRRGNGNVTGWVPFVATTITSREGKGPDSDVTSGNLVTHPLTAEGADASEEGTGRNTPLVPVDLAQVTSKENRSNPQPGDPAGTLPPTSRPAVAFNETFGGNSIHEDVAPTIGTGTGGSATSVATAAVRRLTPVECERLQGFPDGWTAVSAGRPQSDSARYRQLGNSIARPVFAWVARRIMAVEAAGR